MKMILMAALLAMLGVGTATAADTAVTLAVENMDCAACPAIVKKVLMGVEGVKDARVSFADKTATVSFDDAKTTPAALAEATTKAGYPAKVAAK